ncbi:MAG: hypothetical protein HWE39_03570 [Oceanospirillaceae bacterium]|nr:hypothetical protein [Oceanospirillaceae bacterium]
MRKMIRTLIPTFIASATLFSAPLIAAEEEEKPVEMSSYLCKDVMRLSGSDRDIAMALMHGYILGKKGETTFVSTELNQQSNEFFEVCLDQPQANAMATFEEVTK